MYARTLKKVSKTAIFGGGKVYFSTLEIVIGESWGMANTSFPAKVETPFPFFISKKPGEIPIFGTFFSEKIVVFFSILVYFHWKSAFRVRPCLKTSLWRHTLTDLHDFGINGKRRPYPIPRYQTIILWARQFQVHKGGGNQWRSQGRLTHPDDQNEEEN